MTWLQEVQSEMARARSLHPSNHLLLSAMTEEAGEVVKAVLDHMAGKGTLAEVRTELIQTAAMVGRLLEEGDPVHGLPAALCLDEVRHCSHVDETASDLNAQINDGRIIDAVIEKPEAPAPKPCALCEGEGEVLTGMSLKSDGPVSVIPCPKCSSPAPKPCTHERNDWDPSGNDFICSDCGLWSYDDGETWEPKRPAPEDDWEGRVITLSTEKLALEDEVARLKAQLADAARHREALERIVRGPYAGEFASATEVARAALAPKESESSTNQENK